VEQELSTHVKKVLGALHMLSKGKSDFSVSYTDISRISKLEKPMVSSCLKILRDNNFINVVSGGGAATNVYNFLKEVPESAINSIKNLDSDTKQKDETTKPKINNKKRYRP